MGWKFLMFVTIIMPVLMLAYFILVLAAPQLGLGDGKGLLYGAIGSFVIAFPISWYIAKKVF